MTEQQTETVEPAETEATGPTETEQLDQGTEPDADQPADSTDARLASEAARYRRQLRDVTTDRDGLRGQLDAARRHIVEASGPAHGGRPLRNPADLVDVALGGVEIDSLFTDGQLDRDAVAAAAAALFEARPVLFGTPPRRGPRDPGRTPDRPVKDGPSWLDVMQGRAAGDD